MESRTQMKAVIYSRYSSDNQREASIEDQTEICRRLIEREGWNLVEQYDDKAISGASRFRAGYQQMLIDAENGKFDVVVVEALDRLGRKLADIADLYDQLSFLDIRVYAVATGEVTALHIGMLGTMAQLTLDDLREKTKRGQLGRVLSGKIPGGKAYGYEVLPANEKGERGDRRIIKSEAMVVRRIFEDYAHGKSPRAIAKSLNAESVPGPEGREWRDTTIRGQVDRGTGILNNAIYVGRLEWNRCSYVKNPRTGKRVARINPREDWEIFDVPELRIVDNELWQCVKQRQQALRFETGKNENGNPLNRAHRRRYLFSGLLECGVCGGGYTIMGKDRYGCASHRAKGTCTNERTIIRQDIEKRILDGLKHRLMAPELFKEFADEYCRQVNKANAEREANKAQLARDFRAVERKIDGLMKAIEDGLYNPTMKERMAALERERDFIRGRLDSNPDADVIRLHPNLSALYADKVANLENALYEEESREEAGEIIRTLVDKIVLSPVEDGLRGELHGDIVGILAMCDAPDPQKELPGSNETESQFSVVAGAGFVQERTDLELRKAV